jgi:hypothetical protein
MKSYYNQRVGHGGEPPKLTLTEVTQQFVTAFQFLDQQNLLQRSFGYYCVDAHAVAGLFGSSLNTHFYLKTGIRLDGAVVTFIAEADEVRLFTLIEFLFDHVATPDENTGYYHSFSGCGWHHDCRRNQFDSQGARREWRDTVNGILKFYEGGYELSAEGEVVRVAPDGLADMFQVSAPPAAGDTNAAKLRNAVRTFGRGLSSREEQKGAVRDLADLLEFYRPQVKTLLMKDDEAALFNIASSYAIRHHRADQKDNYDGPWLTWLFYLFLSTVHLVLTLIHGQQEAAPPDPPEERSASPTEDDDIPF